MRSPQPSEMMRGLLEWADALAKFRGVPREKAIEALVDMYAEAKLIPYFDSQDIYCFQVRGDEPKDELQFAIWNLLKTVPEYIHPAPH